MAKYVVSDVHGCLNSLKALVGKLNLQKTDHLYFIGDLIDRGPNGKGVIDYVLELQDNGYQVDCVMGNHEWLFLEAINETIPYCWDWRRYQNWMKNGGITTMMSFGYKRIDDLKGLDKKYDAFIRNLKSHIEVDNYILVHAGLNFKDEDIFKDTHTMYWGRNWYDAIDKEKLGDRTIVHGHTPRRFDTLEQDIKELKYPVINIDCGCVYDMRTNIGRLCALNLDTRQPIFQENTDKQTAPEHIAAE